MAKKEYGARKQAILAIIKARPGISSTDVRTVYDAQTGKDSGKSTVSSSLTELHGAGDVRREKVLSDNCGYFYRYWLTTSPVAAAPAPAVAAVPAGTPVHMKPFDLTAANAGAPHGCTDGRPVEILKWDAAGGNCPIIGMVGEDVYRWTVAGKVGGPNRHHPDLVMLPLGFIDGKPVFVGDELIDNDTGDTTTALPTWGGMNADLWSWPAPAPVYPETLLTFGEFHSLVNNAASGYEAEFKAIANAALRHAIDAGQVVPADVSAESVREAYSVGQAIAYKHEAGGRAARDMIVAQVVFSGVIQFLKDDERITAAAYLESAFSIKLPAIIAGVAK